MLNYIVLSLNKRGHQEGKGLEQPHLLSLPFHPSPEVKACDMLGPFAWVDSIHVGHSSWQNVAVETATVRGSSGIWAFKDPV